MGDNNRVPPALRGIPMFYEKAELQARANLQEAEKRASDAEMAAAFANMHIPADIVAYGKRNGIEALATLVWNNGFCAGYRERMRTSTTDELAELRAELADMRRERDEKRAILRELIDATEADCGVPDDGDEDDESVGMSGDGPLATTFGLLRRARVAAGN